MSKIAETITISLKEYKELRYQAARMDAYEQAGVDNWDHDGMVGQLLEEWGFTGEGE